MKLSHFNPKYNLWAGVGSPLLCRGVRTHSSLATAAAAAAVMFDLSEMALTILPFSSCIAKLETLNEKSWSLIYYNDRSR